MSAQPRHLRERPTTERERHTVRATIAVLLAASAALLTATTPARPQHPVAHRPVATTASAPQQSAPAVPATPVEPLAARVARAFLAGYLPYIAGHAPAAAIKDASPALAGSLRAHPPLVSPGMRSRDPRVLSLHTTPTPAGQFVIRVLVNDGELASYPIALLLTPHNGGLLVSSVEGA